MDLLPVITKLPKRIRGRGCKAKGSTYERDLADYLNDKLFPHSRRIARTPLSGAFSVQAGAGMADLTGTPKLWVEAKRTERCTPHEFMAQATRGVANHNHSDMPVVITRRNQQPLEDSLVMLRLKDFAEIYKRYLIATGHLSSKGDAPSSAGLNLFGE